MIRLHRTTPDGTEYWEAWESEPGIALEHWGSLGEEGDHREVPLTEPFAAWEARRVADRGEVGFAELALEEHAIVVLTYPGATLPADADAREDLLEDLEAQLNETLGWTGLGRCTAVSDEPHLEALVAAVEADLAVAVLAQALRGADGLPPGPVLAVREGGQDVVLWPPQA